MRVTLCHLFPSSPPLPSPLPLLSSLQADLACPLQQLLPHPGAQPTPPLISHPLVLNIYSIIYALFLPDPMRLLSSLFQTTNVATLAGVDRLTVSVDVDVDS